MAALDGTVVVGPPTVAIDAASGRVRWTAEASPDLVDPGRHRFCELGALRASCYEAVSGSRVTTKGHVDLIANGGAAAEVLRRNPSQVSLVGADFASGEPRWRSPAFSLLLPLPARRGPEALIFTGIACADANHPTWQLWPSEYRCANTRLVAINW